MKKLLFAVLIAAIAAASFFFFKGEKNSVSEKKENRLSVEQSGATVTIKNFKQVTRDKGKVSGILKAELALIFPEKQLVKLVKPELTYFNKDNEEIIVKAGNGKIEMVSKNVSVNDGVVVKSAEYSFETSELNYKSSDNKIRSSASVIITGRFSRFKADRMIIDLNDTKIEFAGNVKGNFSENN